MSVADIQITEELDHHGHDDHHELSFIEKYIFTTDHKTIGKQFLILSPVAARRTPTAKPPLPEMCTSSFS
jgi:hypothetical protein